MEDAKIDDLDSLAEAEIQKMGENERKMFSQIEADKQILPLLQHLDKISLYNPVTAIKRKDEEMYDQSGVPHDIALGVRDEVKEVTY